nr:TrkA family potassium uptake protein [Ktedonobacteraceae bacterium]
NVPPFSPVIGRRLSQINLPRRSNLALIIRGDEPIFPSGDIVIQENDEVYALVNNEGEEELRRTFGTN